MSKVLEHGFTLLEMVLVIILVGILSAVALPRLATQDYESVFFKDALINGLRYSQKIAIATRQDVGVILENNAYTIWHRDNDGEFTVPIKSPYARERGAPFVISIPKGVSLSGPDMDFYFDGKGKAKVILTDGPMAQEVFFFVDGQLVNLVSETGFIYEDRS